MALSNIFREPRREITESMVGITVFGLIVAVPVTIAWKGANAWVAADPHAPFAEALLLVILGEAGAAIATVGLAMMTHAIGERIYNALAQRGLELRPRRRL
jgi:hypothetical protein